MSMKSAKSSRLESYCKRLDGEWIFSAMLEIYHENGRRYKDGTCSTKQSSDDWGIYSPLRRDLRRRAQVRWSALSGYDPRDFPYNTDQVVDLYFFIKKRGQDSVDKFDREVAEFLGKDADSLLPRSLFDGIEDEP